MNAMHLSSLDLNLLRVFDVLLEERSVTRAGTRLGLTPSAVSHALSRLRYHLGDDLFQRDRQGMQPTRKALEIGPSLHAALGQLQGALLQITETPPDLVEQLDSAQVDFVVSVVDSAPERFARERLMSEALAWVVRAGHPLSERGAATLEDLVGVPHVVVATRREAVERQAISLRSSWE